MQKNHPPSSFVDTDLQLNDIMDFLPDAIFVINKQKRVIIWNRAMAELSGIPAADMLGKDNDGYAFPFYNYRRPILIDFIGESDEVIRRHYPDFVRFRDTISAEIFVPSLKEGGACLWAFAKPLYDAGGEVIGAIESFRDITKRKNDENTIREQKEDLERINRELKQTLQELVRKNAQLDVSRQELVTANEKLRLSEEKFSKAFCLGPVIITISRVADGRYVEVSDYFLRVTGYARDEAIGRTAMELHVWKDEKDRKNIIEALQKTGVVRDQPLQFRSKHGEIFLMLYSAEIISIGEVPHIVSVAVDITERQKALEERERLENQLRQAQKMESIGRLAGGVAHDFNNLLTAIMGNTDMAMAVTEPDGKIRSKLEVIRKASESAADLTRQLLAFSRKQFIEPKIINLNDIIRYMTKMLARMIGENIRLTTSIHTPAAKIMADPGQIEQIIVNLVVNARDAMPRGGRVMMEVGEAEFDADYCNRHPYVLPGDYVSLSVSDTGMGMTEEVSRKIFEPFFTTKPLGKGTGLGLATVYGAVKQNNGSIEVYSAPGQGTSFKIYFPKVSDQAEVLAGDNTHDVVCGGSETILLVEDDSLVREFALDALRRLGYHVIEAASAEEALSVSEAFGKEIHLLLSDVILPGMNGKALADALTILRPDTRVLFTSGYTGDIIAHHGILKEGIAFIEKPYTISSLSKKIRKSLEPTGALYNASRYNNS
ncbi:MAG: PAS domain S-box protein [Desulfosalsimonadaceae bacterium]|nr:PAS domain S-box protein [Desulfosalsimonadaceae bacterium]